MTGLRLQPRSILTLLFIAAFTYAVLSVWDTSNMQVKMFPLTISAIALTLLLVQLVREILPPRAGGIEASGADIDFSEEEKTKEGRLRALELFGWIYGLVGGLWLLGFHVAIPLMIFFFLLRHRESLTIAVALSFGTWLATWGIFDALLHLPFPPGAAFEWLGWA